MKGIAHFLTGVALSTFLPDVVGHAAAGGLLPVLGGVAGLLPDTLDFKVVRFFERHDVAIDPGPEPDAGMIASEIARTMQQAFRSGRTRSVMLHTVREGADLWRQYVVRIGPAAGSVGVQIGPLVSTAQVAVPGSEPRTGCWASVSSGVPVIADSEIEIVVDAFSGPTLTFAPRGNALDVRFLDWHRRWTHSLTFALLLGLFVGGVFAIAQASTGDGIGRMPYTAALVAALGVLGHIAEDQLGVTGSNLMYPITARRTKGFGLFHSGDAVPNFLTVWVSAAMILLNLDRLGGLQRIDPARYISLAIALPVLILGGAYWWQRRRQSRNTEPRPAPEIVSEIADAEFS